MASRQLYPCFACRKQGQEVQVFLDGKDEQGRTKYLNEDGTRHTHYINSNQKQQPQYRQEGKEGSFEIVSLQELQQQEQELRQQAQQHVEESKQQQQQQTSENPLAPVSDESFQRGITAFSMMSELTGLAEKN